MEKEKKEGLFFCVVCCEKHDVPPSAGQGGTCSECGVIQKIVSGEFKYEFTVSEKDISIRHQENNENNLAAFHATKYALQKLFDQQKLPGTVSHKMSKQELKELQITITMLGKHVGVLGEYVVNKYKDAVPTAERKIKEVTPLDTLNLKNIRG